MNNLFLKSTLLLCCVIVFSFQKNNANPISNSYQKNWKKNITKIQGINQSTGEEAPYITKISTEKVEPNTNFTIYGYNFGPENDVILMGRDKKSGTRIGPIHLLIVSISPTEITVRAPSALYNYNAIYVDSDKDNTGSNIFEFIKPDL